MSKSTPGASPFSPKPTDQPDDRALLKRFAEYLHNFEGSSKTPVSAYESDAEVLVRFARQHFSHPIQSDSEWLNDIATRINVLSYSLNDGCLGDIANEIRAKAVTATKRKSIKEMLDRHGVEETPMTKATKELKRPRFTVLSSTCPKCGDHLIHNDKGIECGAMRCDYITQIEGQSS